MNQDDINKIVDSFCDDKFQNVLKTVENNIRNEVNKIIEVIKKEKDYYVSSYIESRIKDKDSFKEKFLRKGYFDDLPIKHYKANQIQQIIIEKFEDIIGFRISCHFIDDESGIYGSIKDNYSKCTENIELQDDITDYDNKYSPKNIYKFHGKYTLDKKEYKFELQVKSLFHNTWSEVDHDAIYKKKQYDMLLPRKIDIFENITKVASAINYQLKVLTQEWVEEKKLIFGLFSLYTYEIVKNEIDIDLLGSSYDIIYKILYNKCDKIENLVKKYVSKKLINEPIIKERLIEDNETQLNDKEVIIKDYFEKEWKGKNSYEGDSLNSILRVIIKFSNQDDLLNQISKEIYKEIYPKYEKSDSDDSTSGIDEDEEETNGNTGFRRYFEQCMS